MNNELRTELIEHMEATGKSQGQVARESGINISQLSKLRSNKKGLGLKSQQKLDAYLAKMNGREPMPSETFQTPAAIKREEKARPFSPSKKVKDIVSLRELMDDAFDAAYKVYFYEDGSFDIVGAKTNKPLSEKPQSRGYRGYAIKHDDYKVHKKTLISHRLVATYYHPNPENKPQVNHKDGNKANNHPDNLEWATGKENIHHAIDTGLLTIKRGEANHFSKLTKEEAMAIRIRRHHRNDKLNDLANAFGVSSQAIQNIVYGKTWKHLDEKPVAVHIDLIL